MSIATNYRPQTFSEVVGQQSVVAALKKIAACDEVTVRSILMYGSWGSGKSTLARLFGKAINCTQFKKTGDVCNECDACKEAMAKNSQSYIEYDTTKVGSVEAVRGMEGQFSMSYHGGKRVFVFDEIHAASSAAQTALLKTVEEGVKDTYFIFCTTHKVLDTLSSRSVVCDITTLPMTLIKDRVRYIASKELMTIEERHIDAIAIKSRGHMRDALSILEYYQLAGEVAIQTPLLQLKRMVLYCLKGEAVEQLIHDIMLYPINDIRNSISVMIRDFFLSTEPFDEKVRKNGLHNIIFQFFYNPVSREALKDEYGIEILLMAFNERIRNKG